MSAPFTRLESDILDALAWDLSELAPDLAGQFAEAVPGVRRNTGSGLFSQIIVDRARPAPMTTPTGRFGTVHAMVGDLPDPIAFQVEMVAGRLIALHGDAYGQDTRALDFARVPYDQVFTIDDRGESIAFDPAALIQPGPLLDLHHHPDRDPPPSIAAHLFDIGAVQRPGDPAPKPLIDVLFGSPTSTPPEAPPTDTPADKADQTSIRVALSVVLGVIALFAIAFFDVPVVLALIVLFVVGRFLNKPAVLSVLARAARRFGQYEYRPPER
ncbi:MAG: hypothetical protein Q8R45_15385 [Brevundimonas sp.]|uniref:hypothetical protein n=1 Tax=Brevundimonas sp. TaxID=1871086 RepID=UPI00271594AF|nr:hypothetical protein [Brevundimonas sp.]MDO9589222.1 hypothetical protein [Brevundimonas sp.]MDP3658336.1 hypothetical protein [Brevundimonas sp.]MDZ4114165.1 hypothetical protein [Brevundimonas sp.]